MPELPEVETLARSLSPLTGRRVLGAEIDGPKTAPPHLPAQIAGQQLRRVGRRGKYLLLHLERDLLAIHLRMSGKLLLREGPPGPHERARLLLEGALLAFDDPRKFGRWNLNPRFEAMGPEPLDPTFTIERLAPILKCKSRLKGLLLDQQRIAGLGNIYVDEALWEARLHPERPAQTLSPDEVARLHAAIRRVLQRGIDLQGTSLGRGPSNYTTLAGTPGGHQTALNAFRQTGQPCPRCQTPIQRQVTAGRGTHLCPHCQI